MSSISKESNKRVERDSCVSSMDVDSEEKSFHDPSTDFLQDVANKKRKLSSKTKPPKKLKPQNSLNAQDDISKEDTENESKRTCVSTAASVIHDIYCWICHKTENTINCAFCARSFHAVCVQSCYGQATAGNDDWVCPECVAIMVAECTVNIVAKWRTISIAELNEMLLFVLLRLYHISGSSHFQVPVDDQVIKDYYTIIKHPVYLDLLKERVMNREYSSVQAFHSEFKWILHNCTVYNGATSVLTNYAKNIDKVCMKEINLMKSCPECFHQRMPFMIKLLKEQSRNSPVKSSLVDKSWDFRVDLEKVNELWMTKLCNSIHSLVWVRLHNYPVWPGKLISLDDESALVLFFGDYDLNVVPLGSICIHTQSNHRRLMTNITSSANRRSSAATPSANSVSKEYQLALEQLNIHLDNIKSKYEYFTIPPKKIEFNIQAGVEYYEKIRIQSNLDTDVIVANSFEDAGVADDLSDLDTSEKHDFRLYDNKCHKLEDSSSALLPANYHELQRVKSIRSSSELGLTFINSFETSLQSLLKQFKHEYMSHLKIPVVEEPSPPPPQKMSAIKPQLHDIKQQTDPVSVANFGVQFSSKDFEKEEELRAYIGYLEKSLASAEIEIRRQEILAAIHHEENLLEFAKQHRELKKIYDNDFMDILKLIRSKFDEKVGRTIQKVKSNEWCAFCSKLARFYCCWNTCYCNHECQSKHWEMHKVNCAQINKSPQPTMVTKNSSYASNIVQNNSTNSNSSIPSMIHHIGVNGSNITDYVNVTHKHRMPLKR